MPSAAFDWSPNSERVGVFPLWFPCGAGKLFPSQVPEGIYKYPLRSLALPTPAVVSNFRVSHGSSAL